MSGDRMAPSRATAWFMALSLSSEARAWLDIKPDGYNGGLLIRFAINRTLLP